jgi:sugar/nucleoside kinase (ribokinase family)
MATHIIFSEESLAKTTGIRDMAAAVVRIGEITQGFVAVTNGPGEVLWSEGGGLWRMPAFKIEAIDTLGAGDVFHGAFTLALLDGHDVFATMRFASAAAAVKCTRFGGGATSPSLAEVQAFLKQRR